jgi:hypothetical protein
MIDQNIIQTIDADLTDLLDRVKQLEKILENFGKKIAKQQEIIDVLAGKIQSCPYD